MSRSNPMLWLAGGSLLILAVLILLLHLESQPNAKSSRPLEVYCAATLKPAMQAIAADYERETGRAVYFEFGDSGSMLANVTVRSNGDLFLPADDSYVRMAREKGLVAETFSLCWMRAVLLTRPGNPRQLAKFDDLLNPGLKLGIANPDMAAIGKVARNHLRELGKWDALAANLKVQFTNVTDSANAVQVGSIDAAIVWDSVTANYPELAVVHVPELDGAIGRVELAVLKSSGDPAEALEFARYTAASEKGMLQLRKFGFSEYSANPTGGNER